jgi:hypothetical protein
MDTSLNSWDTQNGGLFQVEYREFAYSVYVDHFTYVKIWIHYHGVSSSVLSHIKHLRQVVPQHLRQVVPLVSDIIEKTTSPYMWKEIKGKKKTSLSK